MTTMNTALLVTPNQWMNFGHNNIGQITKGYEEDIENIGNIKTIYTYNNITSNNNIVDILDDIKDNKDISKSNYILFKKPITEIVDNMVRYTTKDLQHRSHIEIGNDKEGGYIYLKAVNYFIQEQSENSNNLNKKINNMGELISLNESGIRSEKKELDNKDSALNNNGGAGKGFTEIINSLTKNLTKRGVPEKKIESLIATVIPKITQVEEELYKFEFNIKMPIFLKK